jgi:hypothetical protein
MIVTPAKTAGIYDAATRTVTRSRSPSRESATFAPDGAGT